jgi:hypothetical protein
VQPGVTSYLKDSQVWQSAEPLEIATATFDSLLGYFLDLADV